MERRLTAILAVDMAGYSRLMEQNEEDILTRQKVLRRELFDPQIAGRGGRIVKTTGDGMLVEFASAQDAVRCAINIQVAMADREGASPEDVVFCTASGSISGMSSSRMGISSAVASTWLPALRG